MVLLLQLLTPPLPVALPREKLEKKNGAPEDQILNPGRAVPLPTKEQDQSQAPIGRASP